MTSNVHRNTAKITIGILLTAMSGAAGCRDQQTTGSQNMSTPSGPNRLVDLAEKTGLTIPPTARLVGIEEDDRGEQYLRAKIVLNANDWATFSQRMPVPSDSMDPGTGGFLGQDKDWWDPHAAPGLRTGQVARQSGIYLNIGVDATDPNAVAIYIVQHGT